jgi:hypothetical protein
VKEVCLGVAVAIGAVAAGEFNDFQRPSDFACIERPSADFGQPTGCGDGSQPHNRLVQVTAVSTAATPNLVPLNGLVVFDADYVRIVDHVAQLPPRGREFPKPGALLITLS